MRKISGCTSSIVIIAAFLLAGTTAVRAQCPFQPKYIAYQFQGENDALAAFSGSDQFYTQGLHFRAWRHPECTPGPMETPGGKLTRPLIRRLYGSNRIFDVSFGWEFGQHMFTPEVISVPTLIEDDRPYAGWLYGGLLFAATEDAKVEDNPVQILAEIQFGIIGPESGAEWAQTEVHKLIDDELPMGWDTQLPTEPGLNLYYDWRQRFGSTTADIVPSLGFGLGTIQIYVSAGAMARLGYNISDFGPLANKATINSRRVNERESWEIYAFVGAKGRALAHNIFLDGSLFQTTHSVDKEPLVYDLKAGFSARYGRLRFTYTFIRRSQEFDPLPAMFGRTKDEHDYGSFNISFEKKFN